jgi:hypothetical protein
MLTEVTTVLRAVRPLNKREVTKRRIADVLMRAMGSRSHLDTFETFQARKALKPEDYARALHDIALAQGVKLVQELLNELLTEHLARDMEKTSNRLWYYLDRWGRALSQPRDAATGRFV